MVETDAWLSRKEAAIYLVGLGYPVSARMLEKLASNNNAGKGPPFTRFRRKSVRYRCHDLDAWAASQVTKVN